MIYFITRYGLDGAYYVEYCEFRVAKRFDSAGYTNRSKKIV